MKLKIDLREIASTLVTEFPVIQSLWLFGSRRYRTRSLRSDIYLLVSASDHIRPSDLRQAIRRHCSALDLFVVEGGKATSCMNESFVQADTFVALCKQLDAVCIWSSDPAEVNGDAAFEQEMLSEVTYIPTALDGGEPRLGSWSQSVQDYFREIEAERLPVKPFVGESVEQVGTFILELCENTIAACAQLVARRGRSSWKPVINSEYDLQDAFFLATKPWLPELAREEVTIRFDGQDKRADFSLLESRIVIEMKYIDDANTKAAIAKTLEGLGGFYKRNANINLLLFVIAVAPGTDVDAPRWMREFSHSDGTRKVITRVYPLR